MKAFFKLNGFFFFVLGAIVLAWLYPGATGPEGPIPARAIILLGIFFIFFSQGASLSLVELGRGAADWKLHLITQGATYLLVPLLTVLWLVASNGFFQQPDLRAGFLYLAILPTTITSAVALASVAGGNVGGAVFNTTLSNIAGVFIVPLLCLALFASADSAGAGGPAAGPLLLNVATKILLPMVLGQLCRPFVGTVFKRFKDPVRKINNSVIYFIVYAAFCESFRRSVWAEVAFSELILTVAGVVSILSVSTWLVWKIAAWGGLNVPSQITALYCGSQKTLAVGLPLSASIFAAIEGGPVLSLLLIPLLCYHPIQLVLGGVLAPRLAALPR